MLNLRKHMRCRYIDTPYTHFPRKLNPAEELIRINNKNDNH